MRFARLIVALLLAAVLCHSDAVSAARARDSASPPPSTVYAGVGGVGVFRDAGPADSWTGLTALPPTAGALALATGDSAHWRDVSAGFDNGVYTSHDGGATWNAGLLGHAVRAVLISSPNGRIIAGADRLYRSDDGGKTWLPTITRPITALAQAAGAASPLYAAGTGRVWQSRDGRRWSALTSAGLASHLTINDLAVTAGGTTVYAATTEGLLQSTNGAPWKGVSGVPAKAVKGVVVDGARVIALVADDGLYASADSGQIWTQGLAAGFTALAQDPQQPDMLAAGDKNGAVRWSKDGGQSWNLLGSSVAGNDGNAIRALALVQRVQLPVDVVANPNQAGVVYQNGHTLRGAFLDYWQANRDALGLPETEQFKDAKQGGASVQYFQNMELAQTGDGVAPAPLGAAQQGSAGAHASYVPDAHFAKYWSDHGGQAVFGPAISPLLNKPTGDGTGSSYAVQYFRNARLEYRPVPGGYAVAVGSLGDQALRDMGWL